MCASVCVCGWVGGWVCVCVCDVCVAKDQPLGKKIKTMRYTMAEIERCVEKKNGSYDQLCPKKNLHFVDVLSSQCCK